MFLYNALSRLPWPSSYLGKIMFVSFLGVHVPLIAFVVYFLAFTGADWGASLGVLLVLLGATLIGTAATMAANYYLLAPVRAAAVAVQDYLSTKSVPSLPLQYQDEAGRLMANVQEGITRLDAAIDAAEVRLADEKAASRDKFQTLSKLSHELRTPLNHIIGFSEMMQNEALGPIGSDAYRDFSGNIHTSGGDLLELIQGLLDMSQVEAGDYDPSWERLDVGALVRGAANRAHMQVNAAGRKLNVLTAGTVMATADDRALKQSVLQVVGAMARSGGTDSPMVVRVSEADSAARIAISDTGARFGSDDVPPGIDRTKVGGIEVPEEDHFDQVSQVGFSIALGRSLVRMMGGHIEMRNTDSGREVVLVLMDRGAPAPEKTDASKAGDAPAAGKATERATRKEKALEAA